MFDVIIWFINSYFGFNSSNYNNNNQKMTTFFIIFKEETSLTLRCE